MYVILCICVGVFAALKGRSGIGMFLVSVFLTPVVGLIITLLMHKNKTLKEDAPTFAERCQNLKTP